MARSDLLICLVKAGTSGDTQRFRKVVEALIAEEHAKKHDVLAGRLAQELGEGRNGYPAPRPPSVTGSGPAQDLFFELVPHKRLDDLILPNLVAATCRELIEEHQRRDLLRSYGLSPRNRVLLIGQPGNGKTSLAEAVAEALAVPVIVARYDALIASFLGETAARLRRLMEYVRTRQCVLFFDEFDTIGKERGDEHETGEIKRVVSSLLLQMDDLPSHVVVITATNHPELLDRAVWRRFQLCLELRAPTRVQVAAYFERFGGALEFDLGYSPRTLADKLNGVSYAELEEFLADVARRYVLALPEANPKRIVAERLNQWQARGAAKRSG